MERAVIYSSEALADLESITAFIASDDPQIATGFANRLVDLAESLRRLPRTRPSCEAVGKRACNCAVAIPDLLPVSSGSVRVEVLRFWHGARDSGALEI